MSNKELAIELINQVPEHKLGYVIAFIQGINADEFADDLFCKKLLDEYNESDDKGDFVSFDEAARLCGVDINAL